MKYIHTQTTETLVQHTVNALSLPLQKGEHAFWLLSGGSAIALEVRIAQKLQAHDVSRLTIGLIDERYGPTGHKDENYSQLIEAGFPLHIFRVLTGDTPENTTKAFGRFIDSALEKADFSLGIFGIGADGHTAGIKPHSPAIRSLDTVKYYEWDDYRRFTITPTTISKLDEAIIFANGAEKTETLSALLHTNGSVQEQPAQILKGIKTCTLYTNIEL